MKPSKCVFVYFIVSQKYSSINDSSLSGINALLACLFGILLNLQSVTGLLELLDSNACMFCMLIDKMYVGIKIHSIATSHPTL